MTFEYFDVPFRYNETFISLLFQNPYTLFVFWDISDEDENKFLNKYGIDLYNKSKLLLKISNLTTNETFNINVDPFAKSWYINVNHPNCKYIVEMFRIINNEGIFVSSSNILDVPTDTVVFNVNRNIKFINKYTNDTEYVIKFEEYITSLRLLELYSDIIPQNITGKNISTFKSYILKNPGSLENISSGTRYNFNKEDGK